MISQFSSALEEPVEIGCRTGPAVTSGRNLLNRVRYLGCRSGNPVPQLYKVTVPPPLYATSRTLSNDNILYRPSVVLSERHLTAAGGYIPLECMVY